MHSKLEFTVVQVGMELTIMPSGPQLCPAHILLFAFLSMCVLCACLSKQAHIHLLS